MNSQEGNQDKNDDNHSKKSSQGKLNSQNQKLLSLLDFEDPTQNDQMNDNDQNIHFELNEKEN